LEIVSATGAAHKGERVNCLSLSDNGILYSGGSDGTVRRWEPNLLEEMGNIVSNFDHSVRSLSVGVNTMVIGTTSGDLGIWSC